MSNLQNDAREFAIKAHAAQVDKLGYPYAAHVIHIGNTLAPYGPEAEATGYLHDVVEDCRVSLNDIEARFGSVVRASVDAMTKRPSEDYHEAYLGRLLDDPIGPLAKYADSRHNFGKIHLLHDPAARERLTAKYIAVFRKLEAAQPALLDWGPIPALTFVKGGWVPNGTYVQRF